MTTQFQFDIEESTVAVPADLYPISDELTWATISAEEIPASRTPDVTSDSSLTHVQVPEDRGFRVCDQCRR